MTVARLAGVAALAFALAVAHAQNFNFPDSKAIALNLSPAVEIGGFAVGNESGGAGRLRSYARAWWENKGTQPIVSIELVLLKFDPFDRQIGAERWTVTGRSSGDWNPLMPGQNARDGMFGAGLEPAFTSFLYPRLIRFADGSIWTAPESEVRSAIASALPRASGVVIAPIKPPL